MNFNECFSEEAEWNLHPNNIDLLEEDMKRFAKIFWNASTRNCADIADTYSSIEGIAQEIKKDILQTLEI